MAHTHETAPVHEHEVVEHGYPGMGLMIAAGALLVGLIIALAVLWAQPWDDDGGSTVPVDPPITDDSGGGGDVAPPQDSGGTDGGGSDGGTGGGEPAP